MAAPSFLLSLLLVAPLAGQRPRLDVRVALLASSTLVEDLLATPSLKARIPRLGESPSARAAVAPELSLGATVPLNPRARLIGMLGWQPTTLRAQDAGGARDVQALSLLHALLEAEFSLSAPFFLSAGVGMLGYRSEGQGLFAEGSDLAPLLRVGAGGRWALAGQSVTLRAVGDVHRFGAPLLRSAGGSGGSVLRYGVQVGVVPGGGAR
jgi:hypothetical protein